MISLPQVDSYSPSADLANYSVQLSGLEGSPDAWSFFLGGFTVNQPNVVSELLKPSVEA